ncbi:hypothetical protein D9758_004610 [Tetrapyrgos nigripes]|uniref:CCHC-type domain-containing protein n=1 Tax=Tetrapyrgos nigripes TaxID=182062 RepID=A0A8H5LYU1_9AGAR|nr:hypothetical protein D9758_004610 [Tetrapyrgos nigripes]
MSLLHHGKTCWNCGKKNHVERECYAEGGAVSQAPEWFKALPKEKQKVIKGVNVASQEENPNPGIALLFANTEDQLGHHITSDF